MDSDDGDDGCRSSCRVNDEIWINLGGIRIRLFVVAGWRNPDTGRNDDGSANIDSSSIIVTVAILVCARLLVLLAIILLYIVDSISSLVYLSVPFIQSTIESHQPWNYQLLHYATELGIQTKESFSCCCFVVLN